jgi:hypothetical protein
VGLNGKTLNSKLSAVSPRSQYPALFHSESINRIFRVELLECESHPFHRQDTANLADLRIHALEKEPDSHATLIPASALHP